MRIRFGRKHKDPGVILGTMTLAGVVLLFVQDAAPKVVPAVSHRILAAFSLATIAVAYVIYQLANRAAARELAKTMLLAAAFLFWAANQMWPNRPEAGLYNDIAIGLFVLDVFWVISGWPPAAKKSFLAEAGESLRCRCGADCACCSQKAG